VKASLYSLVLATALTWAVAGGLAPSSAQSISGDSEETRLSMAGRTIVLEPSGSGDGVASDTVVFRISGPAARTISVELLDLIVDRSGQREILPRGSTTHTLDEVVTIGAFTRDYVPNGKVQTFSVTLTSATARDDVRYGGVRVGIAADSAPGTDATLDNTSGILLTALVVPEGFDGKLPLLGEATLGASSLSMTPLYVENFFELILPDIPGVINRGPVAIGVDFVNESPTPFFVHTEWFVTSNGDTLLTASAERNLLFGGQDLSDTLSTAVEISGSTRLVDVLPSFGLVDVRMTGEARLGRTLLDEAERTTSFFVLRWKEPFAVAVALAVIVFLLRPRPIKPHDASDQEANGQSSVSSEMVGKPQRGKGLSFLSRWGIHGGSPGQSAWKSKQFRVFRL